MISLWWQNIRKLSAGFNEQSHSHFESLHQNFRNLIRTLTSLIAVKITSLNEFKSFLKRYYKELKPQLAHANTFVDIIPLIEEKYNVINISCLETIVNHYDVEDAKVHITDYKMEVNTFCEKVTLSVCYNQSFKSVSFLVYSSARLSSSPWSGSLTRSIWKMY